MAKRESPEINAGSMADIAFLLLIFFLVTTTMDKDTAYLRMIPKKVETNKPQTPIQQKNIYKIAINSKQVIQARDSIIKPEDITHLNSRIKHFYLVNRGKKENRDINYPYYGYGSIQLYKSNLQEQEARLLKLESQEVIDERTQQMIDQAYDAVAKWEEKLEMMELYAKFSGKREMPEIDFEAHIRLESFLDTDYSAYVAVQSEVEKAVTEMRDKEAMELFGMTYTAMNNFYQQKKTENTPEVRTMKKHMELIETLFPLKLIEVKPKR
ncbi:ExbD/TolR family protein [Brumimicrobium sp.]|uniref:ExbD/TolR family protein n=1 Tax=Brumimicrobium sp. TaxID=2029867 RepID=UPI0026192B3B|nr:biopolymer transporter ExbD [uncultured Brumimicrobium sp.]